MYRPLYPPADASMLVYLLALTSVVIPFAFVFALLMRPAVIPNAQATLPTPIQAPVVLSPAANRAWMEAERLAVAKAKEMNGKLAMQAVRLIGEPAPASSAVSVKRKRVAQARRPIRVARNSNEPGHSAFAYEPQKAFWPSSW
jgi:hypothetical protein